VAYRHIIWDWNGTLLDDTWLCLEILNHISARRKMRAISLESYRAEFGFPVVDYYRKLGFDLVRDPFERISLEFVDEYNARRLECALFAEAQPVVNAIHELGIDQVILSAHPQDTLHEIVEIFGLRSYFSKLIGLDNIYAAGKTDNGKAHMASLSHAPHEVLLIGDTVHDFEVAREIGSDCVLLDIGHQDRRRLEACGVPVLGSHRELQAVLS